MTENKTVEAEYSRWTESIVGTEVINDAKQKIQLVKVPIQKMKSSFPSGREIL